MKTSAVFVSAAALAALGIGGTLTSQALADTPAPSAPSATATASSASASPSTSGSNSTQKQDAPDEQGGRGRHAGHHGEGRGVGGMRGADADALATKLGLDPTTVKTAIKDVARTQRPAQRPTTRPTEAQMQQHRAAFTKALAAKLGVSESKLTGALDALQAEHNAQRATQMSSRLQQAVKDGKLSQAEADAVVKAIKAGVIGGGR